MSRVVLFLLVAGAALPAAAAQTSMTILDGGAVGQGRAGVIVSVLDESGDAMVGLPAGAFRLEVDGTEVAELDVEPVAATNAPLSLILAVDASGSMHGAPFEAARNASSVFLDQLDRDDSIALLQFGSDVRTLSDFRRASERYRLRAAVDRLAARDQLTHLYDGLHAAIEAAAGAPTLRTAVILLTDGRDEGSLHTEDQVLRFAEVSSVPVFVVGYGNTIDRRFLESAARISGGHAAFTPDASRIAELYQRILDRLREQYLLSFPWDKPAGAYKAQVALEWGGREADDARAFHYAPEPPYVSGGPLAVWLRRGPWVELGLLALFLAGVVLLVRASTLRRAVEESPGAGHTGGRCEVQYPEGSETLFSPSGFPPGGRTVLASDSDNALLRIDALPDPVFLMHQGEELVRELIVARRPAEDGVPLRKDSAYLWVAPRQVSRLQAGKPGHARIFFDERRELYAVEDLGSRNGTYVNGERIDRDRPAWLQDGDVIEVGGSAGTRIVYRESVKEMGFQFVPQVVTGGGKDDAAELSLDR
ncbi:MAG: VWA domain-containing protein [Candidatus Eisenbacteria bacterium]|nr:VWA domain-containing protein [Candidatus Eisenbacteria bacterium]